MQKFKILWVHDTFFKANQLKETNPQIITEV